MNVESFKNEEKFTKLTDRLHKKSSPESRSRLHPVKYFLD